LGSIGDVYPNRDKSQRGKEDDVAAGGGVVADMVAVSVAVVTVGHVAVVELPRAATISVDDDEDRENGSSNTKPNERTNFIRRDEAKMSTDEGLYHTTTCTSTSSLVRIETCMHQKIMVT
jgi:hypothetical protein